MTENPRVVQGFIDIYGAWIDRIRRRRLSHRHREARQSGVLAGVRAGDAARARRRGASRTFTSSAKCSTSKIDPALLARATRVDRAAERCSTSHFAQPCSTTVAGDAGTDELARLFTATHCTKAAKRRRCSCRRSSAITTTAALRTIVRKAFPQASDEEVLKRVDSGARDDVHAARRAGRLLGR